MTKTVSNAEGKGLRQCLRGGTVCGVPRQFLENTCGDQSNRNVMILGSFAQTRYYERSFIQGCTKPRRTAYRTRLAVS